MKIPVRTFLAMVEQIAAEEPAYRIGGTGKDHTCDCIGLIMGAMGRAGVKWRGLHSSNYAARQEMESLKPIAANSDLEAGEAVYKAYEPGQGGYKLPEKYERGGGEYTGDLRDYYHVGVVVSVYPLRIRHVTSPGGAKMDTSLGKWAYHGKLKKIDYAGEPGGGGSTLETVIIAGGTPDAPIHMRVAGSTSASIVADIPQGSEAILIEGGGTWNRISWNGRTGYVMSIFVNRKQDDGQGEKITVSRAELEKAYDILGDLLGLRG